MFLVIFVNNFCNKTAKLYLTAVNVNAQARYTQVA